MRFLLDESADFRLRRYLLDQGHQLRAIAHDYTAGLTDLEVLAVARREGLIIITEDTDFGELVVRNGLPHTGVVLLRLKITDIGVKIARLSAVLRAHPDQFDHFIVVTERRIRVRRQRT